MKTEFVLPGEIEKRSFEIIAAELKERNIKLDNKLAPVICRAIHTTADFDYAHTLVFSEDALDKLKELIKSVTYQEHALEQSSSSKAIAYVGIQTPSGKLSWGAGVDADIIHASIDALVTAINNR